MINRTPTAVSQPIPYAGPATRPNGGNPWRPGFGYAAIFGGSLLVLAFATWFGTGGVIGDAYAPLIGLIVGIPATAGTALILLLPAALYAAAHARRDRRGALAALVIVAAAAFLGIATLTALLLYMPRTHGSGC